MSINLVDVFRQSFEGLDAIMAQQLTRSMKPGDLKVRGGEAYICAVTALRQLGLTKTALAIEEYLAGGKLQ